MVRNDAQRAELRQALDAARAQYGQEAMELLPHIMALGDYCYTICDYRAAVDVYSYGLFVIEVRRAGGSKEEAQLLHRIGCALLKQGRTKSGIEALEKASSCAEQCPDKAASGYYECLFELGNAWFATGRADSAKPYFKRCTQGYDAQHNNEMLDKALLMLVDCLIALGRHHKAIPLLERSVSIRIKMFGSDHLATAESMHRLADTLNLVGRTSEVEQLLRSVIVIREKHLAESDPHLQEARRGLHSALEKTNPLPLEK
ncbi:TPA: tetratricopeptide repeat protein [Pseudomonas aeruginosa]|jgi:tetratricopeptide (TPR) repeat protein|nr:tetratricopeptide repeat protein [Pseudomonas aeruginosa]HDV6122965.1 tetratricopeptide repeat protein [Pseudomonas aeruginosa]HDV6143843.1 tetratricopeptide repeat protein [Pseudomonas aeruginosa]HDV6169541.1 tetratricopeptide repeat protein [Pseudomonas aeruginosa]